MSAGAERIIEHILDDAKAKAAEIKAEAALKSREAAGEAQKEAVRRQEQILGRARDEAAERKRRILGAAQRDARKDKLAVKQELIAAAFKQSLEELCAVDDRSYSSILQRVLLAADLNCALEKAGKLGGVILAEETRQIQGGFILQSGGVEINCSFKALLEAQRDELEPEVAGILFA